MEKKELQEYIETKRELDIIKDKIEYLEEKKTSIKSMIIDDMPKGGSFENDRLGALLGEIEELLNIYNEKQIRLLKQQRAIENTIDKLEDAVDRNIMRLRYIDGYTWERLCVLMNYSWNGIHKKHRKILEKIR